MGWNEEEVVETVMNKDEGIHLDEEVAEVADAEEPVELAVDPEPIEPEPEEEEEEDGVDEVVCKPVATFLGYRDGRAYYQHESHRFYADEAPEELELEQPKSK